MLKEELIRAILKRYHAGICSPEEREIVEDWYQEQLGLSDWDFKLGDEPVIGTNIKNRIYEGLALTKPVYPTQRNNRNWFVIAGAAAVLLLAVTAALYFMPAQPKDKLVGKPDITRNGPKAKGHPVLTLANGEKVLLDGAANAEVIRQGDVEVRQSEQGKLSYEVLNNTSSKPVYNTLTTPRGTKYQLRLPDGTRIWLNAASSITYPTAFYGDSRTVSITGEVYFEVTPNAKKPFLVKTEAATVTVLGTHFNVNAYPDEPQMKTTLLEGQVKISQHQQSRLLEPGEQASVSPAGMISVLKDVNEAQVMGWKDGKFILDKVEVHALMRQLARWYDLEVIYRGEITQHFWGTVSEEMTAAQLFQMLESTGAAHFKLEGNTVIVSP